MDNIFNKIKVETPNNSTFDMSYDTKLSLKMGKLVPCHIQETLPGDVFTITQEALFRMMPMLAPIMHRVDVSFHNFYVPNRILWEGWEKFISGGEDIDAVPPLPPKLDGPFEVVPSSLSDYLGLPLGTGAYSLDEVSALPHAAYQRIWYEFYRDQNLEVEDPIVLADGVQSAPVTAELLTLRSRAWEHDYFTSCLPYAQKGDAVEIPMDLQGLRLEYQAPTVGNEPQWVNMGSGTPLGTTPQLVAGNFHPTIGGRSTAATIGFAYHSDIGYDPGDTLNVNSDDAIMGTTINDLRTSYALQKWLEKNMRAGSRYKEMLTNHFNVRSSDQRLQRPEYIGGSKAVMAISEVLQTSATATGSATPQANMAGHGISVSGGGTMRFRCEEHGYILTILSIRPKTAYQQGIPKHFRKFDRTQYYWPDFAHLGEQEVKNWELFHDPTDSLDNDTFGYIPRFSEYRSNFSRMAGQMRDTLDFWHLGRIFADRPLLNAEFIRCLTDKRIFADVDEADDEIVAHIYHKIRAQRLIPYYGTPGGLA